MNLAKLVVRDGEGTIRFTTVTVKQVLFLLYLHFMSLTDGRVLLHIIKMLTTLSRGYPHLLQLK